MQTDAEKASRPNGELTTEQWQRITALHTTLLDEHHDFLVATQCPSANSTVLGLAEKNEMPAHMWKHGIHAFLEVLRHRRPHSQEYMLAFIYRAYQMMSLLLETMPRFTDTWIECLGDLARYRMAIEEEKETHTVWGGVATRWYAKAADRHPSVGRLYHHSGILERPSLRKFYLFGRALTSAVPFPNAREPLNTLCTPLVEDEQALRKGSKPVDAWVMCFHARNFLSQKTELVGQASNAALTLLEMQFEDSIGALGVPLAVTNIAALLDFGSPNNIYCRLLDTVLSRDILGSSADELTLLEADKFQRPAEIVLDFCYRSFNSVIRRTPRRENILLLLPYVHVMLVFVESLSILRSRLFSENDAISTLDDTLSPDRLDWSALASFLNHVAKLFPILSRAEFLTSDKRFPPGGNPLPEDYMIRGLVWAQWYFPENWFSNIEDDDGSRSIEDDIKRHNRVARVLYLGMVLDPEAKHLRYDCTTRQFSVVTASKVDELGTVILSPSPMSPHSGGEESVESDYVMVPGSPQKRSLPTRLQKADPFDRASFRRDDKQPTPVSKAQNPPSVDTRVEIAEV